MSVDELFDSWCDVCGLPRADRNASPMKLPPGPFPVGALRSVYVPGAKAVATAHRGNRSGYLPGYETVLVEESLLETLASRLPGVERVVRLTAGVAEVQPSPGFVEAVGADGAHSFVGSVRHCARCDGLFRMPAEFLDAAVSSHALHPEREWFVGGFRNRVQLFLREDLHRGIFHRRLRCDRMTVYSPEDCYSLRDYAANFVYEPYRL